jgi:hypothetical protein
VKSKYLCLLVVLPAALLPGVGCGGDDAPSQEEYVAQADEICREADEALDAEVQERIGTKQPNQQQVVTLTGELVVPNLEGQISDLRALTPPEGDEETVEAIYATLETAVQKIADDPSIVTGEPPAEFEEASRLAREHGMEKCGAG